MNVLIVHAHHEPRSFCSALASQAVTTLWAMGHEVVLSDLYAMQFNPVSDRRNFTSVKDPDYLKQQAEESYATEVEGFSHDIDVEIAKLENADAIILSFPLWWFGVPAILKGWFDRVLVAGRVYGGPKIYENGIGRSQKRGLVLMTTGGGPMVYGGWGVNPALSTILAPIQHGIFWFNGILPLDPFVAWSPARQSNEVRCSFLNSLDQRLQHLFSETPASLPQLIDFPHWGFDKKNRYLVVAKYCRAKDDRFATLIQAEQAKIAQWKRQGILLEFSTSNPNDPNWRGFFKLRATDQDEVEGLLKELPLAEYYVFEISELERPK